jgi:DNA-binding NarL/FixJ family response regulator
MTSPAERWLRVAVVEDHPLFLDAVCELLEDEPGITVGWAGNAVWPVLDLATGDFDAVVLDLGLPGVSGAAAVRVLAEAGLPVLVLTASDATSEIMASIAAGARGYLTKSTSAGEIVRAVRAVAAGATYVHVGPAAHPPELPATEPDATRSILSERERVVVGLLAAGDTDAEIARKLRISVRTVRTYLERIRQKTGHRRRADLTRYAFGSGISGGVHQPPDGAA